jgi:hypothetical protein
MDFSHGFDELLSCNFTVESYAVAYGDGRLGSGGVLDKVVMVFHIFELWQADGVGEERFHSSAFVVAFQALGYSLCFS